MNPNNKFEVKTSNFQDWFPSGPIKIEIEKKYADKKEILNHLIELTIEYIKEKGLKINKKEKITCVEEKKPNFLVSAMTGESSGIFFQYFFGTIFFIIENL